MPTDVAESLSANPIKMIHAACTKALRASNILTANEMESSKRMEKALESIVKLQLELIKIKENSFIPEIFSQTVEKIENSISINGFITQETSYIIQEFKNNIWNIHSKFTEQEKNISSLEDDIIALKKQLNILNEINFEIRKEL